MATYIYKAVDKSGNVVRNKVEEPNRFILLKKLKANNLLPISVKQINMKNTAKKQKRNIETSDSILKNVRREELVKNKKSKTDKFMVKLNETLGTTVKVTTRDIVVFTQNFFLLKKANFNNIHALSTVLETTENPTLRAIVEDILLGVEAGENMYVTMEYYEGIFNPIYINMIKVGELSRIPNKFIGTSYKVFG
ncbi:MAG: type II secretion system F family protein [Oscillospiraceae bacterium]|nr:type II secretion system F family protein [Oscillospiraceae bacterium]